MPGTTQAPAATNPATKTRKNVQISLFKTASLKLVSVKAVVTPNPPATINQTKNPIICFIFSLAEFPL